MVASAEPSLADLVRRARAFTLTALEGDAIKLRPQRPRIRAPITPLAQTIFRTLVFRFENVTTGQCDPALLIIAAVAGCAESSVKRLLPELRRTGYLTWQKGPRRRIKTRVGWRRVRNSNRYRMTCPRNHLPKLRRTLIQASGGRQGPLIQVVVSRFSPPSEEEEAVAALVTVTAVSLRTGAARITPPPGPDPPAGGASPPLRSQPGQTLEYEGKIYDDPRSTLARLLAALPDHE